MVMPWSRSARRPSVTKARSMPEAPRRLLADATASSWSSKSCLVSWRRRPMSVDLPSSTDPMVANRSSVEPDAGSAPGVAVISEVTLPLAVLHRRLRDPVVGPGGAPLAHPRGADLGDHLVEGEGRRAYGAGAGGIAHGPEADHDVFDDL